MKIAILIGVSEYNIGLNNLPACKNDIDLMDKLIDDTEEYDEILCLSENNDSLNIKNKVSSFVSKFSGKELDEVFFYFTGHGDFFKDEFYYIFTNFDKSKRNQTSLQNSEVDNWLRSLKPKLTVKVVDACHSGITYIKDIQPIEKYLNETKNQFEKCYFMFSSQNNEASYQNRDISFFTKSFLNAVKGHPAGDIRYKDIIDRISDDFQTISSQTPFFITQASFTEIFCVSTAELQSELPSNDNNLLEIEEEQEPQKEISLIEIVEKDAKKYFNEEYVMKILKDIETVVNGHEYSGEINELYTIKPWFRKQKYNIPKRDQIGKWIEKSNCEYFAKVVYDFVEYEKEVEVPVEDRFGIPISFFTGRQEYRTKYVKTQERIVKDYELTVNYPYEQIELEAEPKYPNISFYRCNIISLLSKSTICLFYFYSNYFEKNWKDRELNKDIIWEIEELSLQDDNNIIETVKSIISSYEEFIKNKIKEKFELKE